MICRTGFTGEPIPAFAHRCSLRARAAISTHLRIGLLSLGAGSWAWPRLWVFSLDLASP